LGRRLMAVVDTEMISELPYVQPSDKFLTVVSAVSHSKLGLTLVGEIEETALITDGDLRRAIEKHGHDSFELQAKEIMTTSPLTVAKGTRVEDALILMSQKNITSLMVEDDGKIIGVFKK
jgi:arabinose-5-phosphate isomerase